MKPKYQGIVALCILAGSVVITILFAMFLPEPAYEFESRPKPNALAGVYIPSSAVLNKMESALPFLITLAKGGAPDRSPVNIGILGYRPASIFKRDGKRGLRDKRLRSPASDYKLTLAFSSGSNSFCIINGSLYAIGDTLPGGEHVAKIDSQKILLKKLGTDLWVEMADRYESSGHKEGAPPDTEP